MSEEIKSAFSWKENSPAETLYLYFGGLYVGCIEAEAQKALLKYAINLLPDKAIEHDRSGEGA